MSLLDNEKQRYMFFTKNDVSKLKIVLSFERERVREGWK